MKKVYFKDGGNHLIGTISILTKADKMVTEEKKD